MSSFSTLADNEFLFTSESVTEGHPDKTADQISDAVLDAVLENDPNGRVRCATLVAPGLIVVAGEIIADADLDIPKIAGDVRQEIGYTRSEHGFDAGTCRVITAISEHSADIARESGEEAQASHMSGYEHRLNSNGAIEHGVVFGYATRETRQLMPMPIQVARILAHRLTEVRKAEVVPYLRPGGSAQVTARYENGKPVEIVKILVSTKRNPDLDDDTLVKADVWEHVVEPVLHAEYRNFYAEKELRENLLVSLVGNFKDQGPDDTGLSGRKAIVDSYGGAARHGGGGGFSGDDPSKVNRSAAYAARYVAKNVVASGLAERCEIQLAYAAGVAEPRSLMVETYGTERISRSKLGGLIEKHFDLRPGAIIRDLDLRRPIFRKTATYGPFGRDDPDFTWEKTDKAEVLRRESGLDDEGQSGAGVREPRRPVGPSPRTGRTSHDGEPAA